MYEQNDILKTLYTKEQLAQRVRELGEEITRDYKDKNPMLVCVLKGASVFFVDLIREIDTQLSIDFICVSSYGDSTTSSKEVRMIKDLSKPAAGRHLILVEDIVDSGRTLSYLKQTFATRGALTVSICTLLDKPSRREKGLNLYVDYKGFQVENEFVVGYGLDFAEKYRNLPYIGVLKPELYK